jgi:hypothetical protein
MIGFRGLLLLVLALQGDAAVDIPSRLFGFEENQGQYPKGIL